MITKQQQNKLYQFLMAHVPGSLMDMALEQAGIEVHNPSGKFTCPDCGSDDVQAPMWVDANTLELIDSTGHRYWCNSCDSEQKYLEETT